MARLCQLASGPEDRSSHVEFVYKNMSLKRFSMVMGETEPLGAETTSPKLEKQFTFLSIGSSSSRCDLQPLVQTVTLGGLAP